MHHAAQAPLRVDFLAPAAVQARQSLVVSEIGKHRLYRAKALAVKLSALGDVNRAPHAFTRIGRVFHGGLKACDLSASAIVGFDWPPQRPVSNWLDDKEAA